MLAEKAKNRPEVANPNLTFSPRINENSRRLASASVRRSSSRISEVFGVTTPQTSPNKQSGEGDGTQYGTPGGNGECPGQHSELPSPPVSESEAALPADNCKAKGDTPQHKPEDGPGPQGKLPPIKRIKYSFETDLTFTPRLNQNSMRILAETGKCRESLIDRLTSRRDVDQCLEKQFTFMPEISKRSVHLVQKLSTTFLSRQQATLDRKHRAVMADKFACYTARISSSTTSPVKKSPTGPSPSTKVTPKALSKCTPMSEAANAAGPRISAARKLSFSRHFQGGQESSSRQPEGDGGVSVQVPVTPSPKKAASTGSSSEFSVRKLGLTGGNARRSMRSLLIKPEPAVCQKASTKEAASHTGDDSSSGPNQVEGKSERRAGEASDEPSSPETNELSMDPFLRDNNDIQEAADEELPELHNTYGPNADVPKKKRLERKISLPKHMDINRVRRVKDKATAAIKHKKVFAVYGPYPMVRHTLRKRGWVEHEYNIPKGRAALKKKKKKKVKEAFSPSKPTVGDQKAKKQDGSDGSTDADKDDDDDDDDDDDGDIDDGDDSTPKFEGYEPMTVAEKEEWGMLSRAVKYGRPHLIWSMLKDDIEFKFLEKDQYVNHFREGHAFTTKVGICRNLRHLSSFCQQDPDEFFPRCYILSSAEDRDEFVDNYRLTAAISILKSFCGGANKKERNWPGYLPPDADDPKAREHPDVDEACVGGESNTTSPDTSPETVRRQRKVKRVTKQRRTSSSSNDSLNADLSVASLSGPRPLRKRPYSSAQPVIMACRICELYLMEKEHEFLDHEGEPHELFTDEEWANLISQFYLICHDHAIIEYPADDLEDKGFRLLERLKDVMPQYNLDGLRNVWIVKPGAKSRGRGIFCVDRLDKILSMVDGITTLKESKWVVQKYIERPLLIHGTKFDIRQWFLVTDWNPMVLWFYKSSYLRFCGQHFTLRNLSPSIHLANNAIQRHLEVDSGRSSQLPDDNMWSSDQFQEYLKSAGKGDKWAMIYQGMKDAIIGTLLSMQDVVDSRKHSFELFGADFMLTTDYRPWLIEINCSPALSASTRVTGRLCAAVIEDTMKVVLDRRSNKKADTGDFELAFRRPHISMPSYVGSQLAVAGQQIKRQQG